MIVCTRDRPGELEDCLTALASLKYPSYEVLVVDNASIDERTAAVAARFGVRYVRESRPGLDWARNRGIRESRYSIIAFIDDDARADPNWLSALARAFEDCQVDAVTGLVAPLELETEAQQLYEFAYGGMGKGFESRHLDRSLLGPDQLLRVQKTTGSAPIWRFVERFSKASEISIRLSTSVPRLEVAATWTCSTAS